MKRITLWTLTVMMCGMADGAPAPANEPCRQITHACKSAGFVRGEAKEGKGLFKDCVQPILKGQTVQGVTVDPSVVQACQQKKHNHPHNGNGGNQGNGGTTGQNQTPPSN
jgi:hypothetical protein